VDFDRVDVEAAVRLHEVANHLEPLLRRRRGAPLLQRLDRSRHEDETVERERFEGVDRGKQMADVWRVKTAAEDPEPHGSGGW